MSGRPSLFRRRSTDLPGGRHGIVGGVVSVIGIRNHERAAEPVQTAID